MHLVFPVFFSIKLQSLRIKETTFHYFKMIYMGYLCLCMWRAFSHGRRERHFLFSTHAYFCPTYYCKKPCNSQWNKHLHSQLSKLDILIYAVKISGCNFSVMYIASEVGVLRALFKNKRLFSKEYKAAVNCDAVNKCLVKYRARRQWVSAETTKALKAHCEMPAVPETLYLQSDISGDLWSEYVEGRKAEFLSRWLGSKQFLTLPPSHPQEMSVS